MSPHVPEDGEHHGDTGGGHDGDDNDGDNDDGAQEGSPTTYQVAACSPQNFDERLMIYTTLFKVCSIFSVRSSSYFYGFDNCNGLLTR